MARPCPRPGAGARAARAAAGGRGGTLMGGGRTATGPAEKRNLMHRALLNTLEALRATVLHLSKSVVRLRNKHYYRMAKRIAACLVETLSPEGSSPNGNLRSHRRLTNRCPSLYALAARYNLNPHCPAV